VTDETGRLAIAMLALGALAGLAALLTRVGRRSSVPVALLFLGVGVAAGANGIGGVGFDDHVLAYQLGTCALVLILFDGGLNTRFDRVRPHLAPALTLATLGVIINAAVIAGVAWLVGFAPAHALVLGAVTSCTDAAAVFSVLRGGRIHLPARVDATLELESGLNDPMAVILTTAMAAYAVTGEVDLVALAWRIPVELAVGTALGAAIGVGCRLLLHRLPPTAIGLLPVMTAAAAAMAFGGASLAHGSGFLAVYVCGLVLGNRDLPDRAGLRRVHDFLAWLAQVVMFVALGLLVSWRDLTAVGGPALILALALVALARPLAVAICLVPFRYPRREIAYLGWVGLRGAVPIILAAIPILVGAPGAAEVFHVVFVVVIVSSLVQGTTVRWLTRRLGLLQHVPPPPPAALEIASMRPLGATIACYHIDHATAVAHSTIAEVPFPDGAAVMLVVRGAELIAPRGATRFELGDHVFVFCKPADEPTLALWFGRRLDD
jgi:cell volume regulation protein A